jgi:replicative DNA helicase Mcm
MTGSISTDREPTKILSVQDAKQVNSGKITIMGVIISRSSTFKTISKTEWMCNSINCADCGSRSFDPPRVLPLDKFDGTNSHQLRCTKCESDAIDVKHQYHDSVSVQIVDTDKTDNYNALEVMLYDEASRNIIAGEVVTITGNIHIQRKCDRGNTKRLVNVLHGNCIIYKNKEETKLTNKDIELILRHKNMIERHGLNYIDVIVSMFAPNIIGYNDKKLGLLRSLVGGLTNHGDDNGRRGRIHTMLVGDPGLAKSVLSKEATKLQPNSRYVTATNASGKSLVIIIDKENDSLIARYGAVVLSKGSTCVVNELGAMSLEDQKYLLDIAEEGRCTIDKYGFHLEVDSPTTIIATANPYNQTWNGFKISKDEIPALKSFLDRFDQIYGLKDAPSEEEIRAYPKLKTAIRERKPHNYNFLRKILTYAKTISPHLTEEAKEMLNQFWINAKKEGLATNRTYEAIFRIAEAQAKLSLSNEINEDIAMQTMNSISLMWSQYGKIVRAISSPREFASQVFYQVLKVTRSGMTIYELCKKACNMSNEVKDYLGDKYELERNHKLKSVIDVLLNNSRIRRIGEKPMVLKYIENTEINNSFYINSSDVPDLSDAVSSHNTTASAVKSISFDCYYCDNYKTNSRDEYERHVILKHPTKPCYPGKADLEKLGLTGKGQNWEI